MAVSEWGGREGMHAGIQARRLFEPNCMDRLNTAQRHLVKSFYFRYFHKPKG